MNKIKSFVSSKINRRNMNPALLQTLSSAFANPMMKNMLQNNPIISKFFQNKDIEKLNKTENFKNILPIFNILFILVILYNLKINLDILNSFLKKFELELRYNNENVNKKKFIFYEFIKYLKKNSPKLFDKKQLKFLSILLIVFLSIVLLVFTIKEIFKNLNETNTNIFEENLSFTYITLVLLMLITTFYIVIIIITIVFIISLILIIFLINDIFFIIEQLSYIFTKKENNSNNTYFIKSLIEFISKISIIATIIMMILGIICVILILILFKDFTSNLNFNFDNTRAKVEPKSYLDNNPSFINNN
jgi:hypothetical protein